MYDRSINNCNFLAERIPQLPNPLFSVQDILSIIRTISYPRIHVLPSRSRDEEVGEYPTTILNAFRLDMKLFSTINSALLDYLERGIDPSIVLDNGILGASVVRATLEARQNKAEGETGLVHFYGSTLFEAVNRFIWLDEPRNHQWVAYGVSRRSWRAIDTSTGRPSGFKYVVDGFTRVVFYAKPLSDDVMKDLSHLVNEPDLAGMSRHAKLVLSTLNQVYFPIPYYYL